MAFGKSSNKTQKTKAEVPSKAKTTVAASKARTPEPILAREAKEAAELASSKIRRKSSAVVKVDSALQDNVVTQSNTDAPKTMAAAAGHSATSALAHSISAENGLGTGHANGSSNGHNREAIAQRAYFYWAERGFTHGLAEEDWKRAEAELTKK